MSVDATTCMAARRTVQRLYRGEDDGFRGNEVFVDGWDASPAPGSPLACDAVEGTIRADYQLGGRRPITTMASVRADA